MKVPRPRWSTIAVCVGLFLFFLLVLFPFQNLKGYLFSAIQKNTGIILSSEDLYPSFFGWPGVGMRNVEVLIPTGQGLMEISAKKVVARVGIGSLFPPRPSISLSCEGLKGGGDLWLKFTPLSNASKGAIEASAVNLSQFVIPGLPAPLEGVADIQGDFYLDDLNLNKSTGRLNLSVGKFQIPALDLQGFVLPAFNLGKLEAFLQTRNGNMEIVKSQIGEPQGDFRGRLVGELRMGQNIGQSFLNLTLFLQLSEKFRADTGNATIVSFLNNFQRAPGDYGLKWSSSIMDMQRNYFNALPQKTLD